MDFFKNFYNQLITHMPKITIIAHVNAHIKNYLKEMDRDETFQHKFIMVLKKFINKDMTLDNICMIVSVADDIKLSRSQISYFCDKIYDNDYIINILQKYIDSHHLHDEDIQILSEFLVHEINNAIVYVE
jgi:hypothetical protein